MTSKIAPLAPAPATVALCDRCAVTLIASPAPALSSLRLRGARILVDKLAPVGAAQVERVATESGVPLFAPVQASRARQTYGIEAHVLAIGPDIDPADIAVGDRIIIDEFGGRPLWWDDRTLPYWIVGEGEVMIAIARDADTTSDGAAT
jgi:co-chaperonin GroES (HSP10)